MNCTEFLIVFDERDGLNEAAALHLKICGDCRKLEKTQTEIWRVIDDFKTVDAPKTFDFSVKARIAAAQPNNFQSKFLPVLRYVLPLGLIVLVLGFVAFKAINFSDIPSPQVAKVAPSSLEKEVLSGNAYSNELNTASGNSVGSQSNLFAEKSNEEAQVATIKSLPEKRNATPKRNEKESGGGSRDSALTQGSPKFPRGLSPNQTDVAPLNLNGEKSFTVGEVLSFLGVESVSENGKQRVKAVKENSLAGRSGVKVGDVIEAINGLSSDEPIRAERIEGKTLTVLRGAERIVINLRN